MLEENSSQVLGKVLEAATQTYGSDLLPPSFEMNPDQVATEDFSKRFRTRREVLSRFLAFLTDENRTDLDTGDDQKKLQALNSIDSYIIEHEENVGSTTLRDSQFNTFLKFRNFLERGGKDGYFKLPTGYGKTVLFIEAIKALGCRALVVVPKLELLTQTRDRFKQFAPELEVGLVYGDEKALDTKITIATYDSFVSQVEQGKIKPEDYDCLILDEAHGSLSPKRSEIISRFQGTIRLGFTATPKFSEEKHLGHLLDECIHEITARDAIEDGHLCSVKVIFAKAKLDLSNITVNAEGEYDEKEFAKAINNEGLTRSAIELYQKHFADKSAIFYCAGVEHSKAVTEALNKAGIPAGHIDGEMDSEKERAPILKKHANGEIKVICNANLLIEGYDDPGVEAAFNLRQTSSLVVAEQRGGRVLRLNSNDPAKFATIVEFLFNDDRKNAPKAVTFSQILDGEAEVISGANLIPPEDRPDHPLDRVKITIEGLDVITESNLVKEIARELDDKNDPAHKEMLDKGYLTIQMVSDKTGIGTSQIRTMFDLLLEENPEQLKVLIRDDRRYTYCHQDFLPKLQQFYKDNLKPGGWVTASELVRKSMVPLSSLTAIGADQNPEYVRNCLFPRACRYYNPAILKKFDINDLASQGWQESIEFARYLGITLRTLLGIAKKYEASQPGLIRRVKKFNGDVHPIRIFDPKLVKLLLNDKRLNMPGPLLTASDAANKLGISEEELLSQIDISIFNEAGERLVSTAERNRISEKLVKTKGVDFLLLAEELGVSPIYFAELVAYEAELPGSKIWTKKSPSGRITQAFLDEKSVENLKAKVAELRNFGKKMTFDMMVKSFRISERNLQILLEKYSKPEDTGKWLYGDSLEDFYAETVAASVQGEIEKVRSEWIPQEEFCEGNKGGIDLIELVIEITDRVIYSAGNLCYGESPYFELDDQKYLSPQLCEKLKAQTDEFTKVVNIRRLTMSGRLNAFFIDKYLRISENVKYRYPAVGPAAHQYIGIEFIEKLEELAQRVKNWKSIADLSKETPLTIDELIRCAEAIPGKLPTDLATLDSTEFKWDQNLRISPRLIKKIKECLNKAGDWIALAEVAERYKVDVDRLKKLFYTEFSEEIKSFWNMETPGKLELYASPRMVQQIRDSLIKTRPDEYLSLEEIAATTGKNVELIMVLLDAAPRHIVEEGSSLCNTDENPDVFIRYYGPVVMEKVLAGSVEELAPAGWQMQEDVMDELGTPAFEFMQALRRLTKGREEEMIRKFHDPRFGQKKPYLSPELIELLEDEL